MRDNEWLENRMDFVIRRYFADAKIPNSLYIKFGQKARTRLGSIRKRGRDTEITMCGHFKDDKIPEFVVDAVIGHELCHYVHGFSSPLPQLARHPHSGGLVSREMSMRGMGELEKKQKKWIKDNWLKYLKRA